MVPANDDEPDYAVQRLNMLFEHRRPKRLIIRMRTPRWAGHVARMDKTRLPRRLLTAWVANFRPTGGAEMTYGRSLERWLKYANFRSNYPSGRSLPKTGRNGAPSSPRREHEIAAQEVGITQQQQEMPCNSRVSIPKKI